MFFFGLIFSLKFFEKIITFCDLEFKLKNRSKEVNKNCQNESQRVQHHQRQSAEHNGFLQNVKVQFPSNPKWPQHELFELKRTTTISQNFLIEQNSSKRKIVKYISNKLQKNEKSENEEKAIFQSEGTDR
jgi:hypothetical protein